MQRRNFLAGILAAGMAPAIVRAESLMRIVVPKLYVPDWAFGDGIYEMSAWMQKGPDGAWMYYAERVATVPDFSEWVTLKIGKRGFVDSLQVVEVRE